MSFLAIDVGNTRLKWAQYAEPRPGAAMLAHGAVFLETIDELAESDWKLLAPPAQMLGCVVAGEAVRRRVEEQLELWDMEPHWVVSSASEAGLVNGYDHPNRLGADRWVSLIGARARLMASGPPRPALVVMIGTAATVDAIDADGRFLGGLILPGFGLMLKALEMGTAGLKFPTGDVVDFPTNTSDALMSGGANAIAGAIERQHRKLLKRTGQEPALFMTGGAGVSLGRVPELAVEAVGAVLVGGRLLIQSRRSPR